MDGNVAHANLVFAWLWILAGFFSGMVLGLKFQDERWLGGYASLKRRMHRLAHISFFGLGAVNLLFYFTVRDTTPHITGLVASWAFILGGVAMPVCCWLMGWNPKAKFVFAVPVLSLLAAATLTLFGIII